MSQDLNLKQRLERRAFELLKKNVPDIELGLVEFSDESAYGKPDVVITRADMVLGIEVTEVGLPDQMLYQRIRSQAVHRFEIVDEAHDLWKILKHPALDCTVFFSNQVVLGKKHQKPLSDLIFLRILDSHERVLGEGLSEIIEDDLPPEILRIVVRRPLSESNPVWQHHISGLVHERCIEMFQTAINRKHDRLRNYLNCCQECWLVL